MLSVNELQKKEFCFELKSEGGHTLLKSISFPNKKIATETAKDLNRLIKRPSNFERKTNHSGQFHFNFKNSEGVLIGSSQLYNSEAGMENGIKNLTRRIKTLSKTEQL